MFRSKAPIRCALALLAIQVSVSGCGKATQSATELQTAPTFVAATSTSSPQPAPLTVGPEVAEPQLLNERDDYTVAAPDIVQVSVKLPSREEEVRLRGVNGEHLVSPDGGIDLGARFGIIPAAGLTPQEIQRQVQQRLAAEAQHYDVTISVVEQNSKFYYIIVQGDGSGDTVMRMPLVTGEEDITDALQHVKATDLKGKRIWISRPLPGNDDIILQVNADASQPGWTHHRILPGDRIYIASSARGETSK